MKDWKAIAPKQTKTVPPLSLCAFIYSTRLNLLLAAQREAPPVRDNRLSHGRQIQQYRNKPAHSVIHAQVTDVQCAAYSSDIQYTDQFSTTQ